MTDAWLSMAAPPEKVCRMASRSRAGHSHGRGLLQSRGRFGVAGRRNRLSGLDLRDREMGRVATQIYTTRFADLDFYQSLPALNQGIVAQQIFWYTAFTAGMAARRVRATIRWMTRACRCGGWPLSTWPLLGRGDEIGYQDCGSLTMFKSTPLDRRKATWCMRNLRYPNRVAEKEPCGLTIIRDSDIDDESFTERAPKLGGLVEFIARQTACCGPRPGSTFPIIRNSPSSGGSRSAM